MRLVIVNTFCLSLNKERQHKDVIAMRLAALYFFVVNLVMRLNGHVFFNPLNKMSNAATENVMRRGPRN